MASDPYSPKNLPYTIYWYDTVRRNSSGKGAPEVAREPCLAGEVRWHSESKTCFTPTQVHVNILLIESVLLAFAFFVILALALKVRSLKKGSHND